MTVWQAIALGIVQGATEFIPVSSSGHLVLVPWLLGWEQPALSFIVMLHLGTITGVLLFFHRDWLTIARSTLRWMRTGRNDTNARLSVLLLVGILPAALVGVLFRNFFETVFQQPLVVALMLLITAALLLISERLGRLKRDISDMTWADSLIIGLAQTLALMPGISRSGATIAAGRLRDMQRDDAARFSFLLLTPLLLGLGIFQTAELAQQGISLSNAEVLAAGFLAALGSSFLVIKWLLNFLRTRSTAIFALYCLLMSASSLLVLAVRGA